MHVRAPPLRRWQPLRIGREALSKQGRAVTRFGGGGEKPVPFHALAESIVATSSSQGVRQFQRTGGLGIEPHQAGPGSTEPGCRAVGKRGPRRRRSPQRTISCCTTESWLVSSPLLNDQYALEATPNSRKARLHERPSAAAGAEGRPAHPQFNRAAGTDRHRAWAARQALITAS